MTKPLPTPRQIQFQDWEFGIFLHFGIRTFYEGHRDWDGQPMTAADFRPSAFDCGNWAASAAAAGAKYMVMTAKHHDGFANWPSKYTDFSVANSPWRDGKGDIVREFVDACHREKLAVGIYYSPADASAPKYENPRQYDDYFLGQVSELLTGYGQIDMLWFDGCGSEGHEYDWGRIVAEMRRLQPQMLIFNMGDPDYRWVGNEAGLAPWPCWNIVAEVDFSVRTDEREKLANGKWLPAECDCRMRQRNWFYSDADEHTVKSLEELMGLYYCSVGRGCNLLLNIGPDRRGLLPEKDRARLLEFGTEIRRRFGSPLASIEDFTRTAEDTWTYTASAPCLADHLLVQEDLSRGEQVRAFDIFIEPWAGGAPILVYRGLNIGHKAICRFPLLQTAKISLKITAAAGPVCLRGLNLYNTAAD